MLGLQTGDGDLLGSLNFLYVARKMNSVLEKRFRLDLYQKEYSRNIELFIVVLMSLTLDFCATLCVCIYLSKLEWGKDT